MSTPVTKNYNFAVPAEYTYDPTKIEITGGLARLILADNPGQQFNQPFDSDAGFTYNPALVEFTGGLARQKDQRPANATFGANYGSGINGNWGGGTLTGTAFGGAAIEGGKLKLDGGGKYVQYSAVGNANSQQVGAARFRYTPNYSGAPGTTQSLLSIFRAAGSVQNLILLHHNTARNLVLSIYAASGSPIVNNSNLGNWPQSQSVEYEFELNWDVTTGATRLFINGTQFGSTQTATGTRDSNINLFNLGADYNGTNTVNCFMDDVEMFSTVQHTTNYTPGYVIPNNVYALTTVSLPTMTYSGIGDIQEFTGVSTTESGNARQVWNDLYWTGSAWAASDGSWAQSSPVANILANIASFPASDTLNIDVVFNLSNTVQSTMSNLAVTYIGQTYPTDNPKIIPTTALRTDVLQSLAETVSKAGSDDVRYALSVGGVEKWWDGAAWSPSSGYAQTNTAAEITLHASALLVAKADVIPVSYLHSASGMTTPQLLNLAETGDFAPPDVNAPVLTPVYGWVYDANGNPLSGIQVTAHPSTPAGYNLQLDISTKRMSAETDVAGYWEMFLVNTDGMPAGTKYEIKLAGDEYAKTYLVSIPVNANGFNVLALT